MSSLTINIPHQLSKEEALNRIKNLLANLKQEQKDMISEVKEDWSGDGGSFAFSAKGFSLSGNIQVSDTQVVIDAELPFALSLFKGTISSIIEERAKTLLS